MGSPLFWAGLLSSLGQVKRAGFQFHFYWGQRAGRATLEAVWYSVTAVRPLKLISLSP